MVNHFHLTNDWRENFSTVSTCFENVTLNQIKLRYANTVTVRRYILCVGCLKNVRNVVQFNKLNMLSAIALHTITTIEPDKTMKLSTLVVYCGKQYAWLYFVNAVKVIMPQCNVAHDHISCVCYFRNVV